MTTKHLLTKPEKLSPCSLADPTDLIRIKSCLKNFDGNTLYFVIHVNFSRVSHALIAVCGACYLTLLVFTILNIERNNGVNYNSSCNFSFVLNIYVINNIEKRWIKLFVDCLYFGAAFILLCRV